MKHYKTRTLTERRHTSLYADALRILERDILDLVVEGQGVPDDWRRIACEPEAQMGGPREKITMRVPVDVLRFFRAMGPGYQDRIVRVLKAWMHGRLAKVIDGPDTTDLVLRPEAVEAEMKERDNWGVTDDDEAFYIYACGQRDALARVVETRKAAEEEARQKASDPWRGG